MLCQKCQKKNATVKIVKNHNGHITEEYLCKDCAGTVDLKFKDFGADGIFDNFFNLCLCLTVKNHNILVEIYCLRQSSSINIFI